MTPRERVESAFAHQQPDCTPCDYFGTPEINQRLENHFGVTGEDAIRKCLGVDLYNIRPPYIGPPLRKFDDGSTIDIWGVRKKPVPNEYGEYNEPIELPYAEWTTVEEVEAFSWPNSDWFDYEALSVICKQYDGYGIMAGDFGVQDFINGVAFGRGVEQTLIDIALEDPVYLAIMEKRHRFYMEFVERMLEACEGRIDVLLCGDDFGSQKGALISPASFDRLFSAKKKELFDLVHSFGAKVSHHCCGSSVELIPRFIENNMDALQTIQPQAHGMNPYELKRDFGDRLVLHGAVDVQGWLQRANLGEVEQEVNRLMDEVGRNGGFILGPCHNIQPDTPMENVLALYSAVAKRRT